MKSNENVSSSNTSYRSRWILAIFAIAAIAAPALYFSRGPAVQAEDPPKAKSIAPKEPDVEFFPKPSASEERILAAFGRPADLDFHESPLQTVVDFLKDKYSIEIHLDVKALEDGGMRSDTPVTCKVSGISLRSALRLMFSQIDVAFLIHDEVLLVTTEEVADAELVTRTYPVADLTPGDQYDSLIDAITTAVFPNTWDEVGGPGTISSVKASRSLVVLQKQDVQDEVLQLLRSLRAARKAGGVEWSAVVADAAATEATSRRGGGLAGGGMGGGKVGAVGVASNAQNCSGGKIKDGKGKGGMGGGMF